MCEHNFKVQCHSPLSELMEKFIHEKQAYGYTATQEGAMNFLGWTVSYAKSVYNPLNCLVTSSISGQQNRLMRNRATRSYE